MDVRLITCFTLKDGGMFTVRSFNLISLRGDGLNLIYIIIHLLNII